MILLDTHVLIWLSQGNRQLGRRARSAIERVFRGDGVHVSAISFWEIALLVDQRRLRLESTVEEFRRATLATGVMEAPVDGEIAIGSTRLTMLPGDPSDRIIVASALAIGATLITADDEMLDMSGGPKRIDARL